MGLPKTLTSVTPFSKFLALVFFIMLPFLGFFFGMAYQKQIDGLPQESVPTEYSSPSPTPTPPQESSFQKILKENCRVESDSALGQIEISRLPVKVDRSLVVEGSAVTCELWGENSGYLSLKQGFIYDNSSQEPGRGGSSLIKPLGTKFKEVGDTVYYAYIDCDCEIPVALENERVVVRSIKKIALNNEEVFYNLNTDVIAEADAKLLELLKKYSKENDFYGEENKISSLSDDEGALAEVISTLFKQASVAKKISDIEKTMALVSKP